MNVINCAVFTVEEDADREQLATILAHCNVGNNIAVRESTDMDPHLIRMPTMQSLI